MAYISLFNKKFWETNDTPWAWYHNLTPFKFVTKYDVYFDPDNASNKPYMYIGEQRNHDYVYWYHYWSIRTYNANASSLSGKLPITVKLQINGKGTTYTFTSNSTLTGNGDDYHPTEYYYVTFPNSTQKITIPDGGTEFTINLTITTKTGETYKVTEHACGPISTKLTGSTSLVTGKAYTYTFSTALSNGGTKSLRSDLSYAWASRPYSYSSAPAYVNTTTILGNYTGNVSKLTFVVSPDNAESGDTTVVGDSTYHTCVQFYYYYKPADTSWFSEYDTLNYNGMLISVGEVVVKVSQRSGYDDNVKPVITVKTENLPFTGSVSGSTYNKYIPRLNWYSNFTDYIEYSATPRYGLSCGSLVVTDYTSGRAVQNTPYFYVYGDSYSHPITITKELNNAIVRFTQNAETGTIVTEVKISAYAYSKPTATLSVRRCREKKSSESTSGCYQWNNKYYKNDDNGAYCYAQWHIEYPALDNKNKCTYTIETYKNYNDRWWSGLSFSGTLTSTSQDGFVIFDADTESSWKIVLDAFDDGHPSTSGIPWSSDGITEVVKVLSTVPVIMDYRKGGEGIGFGKVSENQRFVEVAQTWNMRLPAHVIIKNYYGTNQDVDLAEWFDETQLRIQKLNGARPVELYKAYYLSSGRWPNTSIVSSAVAVTSSYAKTDYYDNCLRMTAKNNSFGGMKLNRAVQITKQYLYFNIMSWCSYCGDFLPYTGVGDGYSGAGIKFRPAIYLLSSEPTTINQSTGKPNGTIVHTQTLDLSRKTTGSSDPNAHSYWYMYNQTISIDVSRWNGQKLWILFTTAGYAGFDLDKWTSDNYFITIRSIRLQDSAT